MNVWLLCISVRSHDDHYRWPVVMAVLSVRDDTSSDSGVVGSALFLNHSEHNERKYEDA